MGAEVAVGDEHLEAPQQLLRLKPAAVAVGLEHELAGPVLHAPPLELIEVRHVPEREVVCEHPQGNVPVSVDVVPDEGPHVLVGRHAPVEDAHEHRHVVAVEVLPVALIAGRHEHILCLRVVGSLQVGIVLREALAERVGHGVLHDRLRPYEVLEGEAPEVPVEFEKSVYLVERRALEVDVVACGSHGSTVDKRPLVAIHDGTVALTADCWMPRDRMSSMSSSTVLNSFAMPSPSVSQRAAAHTDDDPSLFPPHLESTGTLSLFSYLTQYRSELQHDVEAALKLTPTRSSPRI